MRAPGAPIVIGQGPNALDMATSRSSYNSLKFIRAYACEVEMAKWLDIPNWRASGHTDAQVVDARRAWKMNDETLAVDVITAGSPGGDFLGQRHARRHLRSSQKARDLLETHELALLPAALVARVDAVVRAV